MEFLQTILGAKPESILQLVFWLVSLAGYAVFNEVRRHKTVKDRNKHFESVDSDMSLMKLKLENSEEKLKEKSTLHDNEIERIKQDHEAQIMVIIESFSKKTEIIMMKREIFESTRHAAIYDAIHSTNKAISGKFLVMRFEVVQKFRDVTIRSMIGFECPTHPDEVCPMHKPITDAQMKGYEAAIAAAVYEGEECAELLISNFPWETDGLNDRKVKEDGAKEVFAAIVGRMTKEFPAVVTDIPDFDVMPIAYVTGYFIELIETVRDIKKNELKKINEARANYEHEVKKIWGDRRLVKRED